MTDKKDVWIVEVPYFDTRAKGILDRLCISTTRELDNYIEKYGIYKLKAQRAVGKKTFKQFQDYAARVAARQAEEAHEWDALTKKEMWDTIQEIRTLVRSDGTRPIIIDIEDYAARVAALHMMPDLTGEIATVRGRLKEHGAYYYVKDAIEALDRIEQAVKR
jgi:hypothetical protein